MSAKGNRARSAAPGARGGLLLLIAALVVGGLLTATEHTVHADDLQVAGTLALQPDGGINISDGLTAYGVVGAIDFSPFLGRALTLLGQIDVETQTFFVTELTLGTITIDDQEGTPDITTSGMIEQSGDSFQATIEGIAFNLQGSDRLPTLVGQTEQIEGQLVGTWISVSSLSP